MTTDVQTTSAYGPIKVAGIALLIVAGVAAAVTAINLKAAAAIPQGSTAPLPVETVTVEVRDSYQFVDRFAGALEARQETGVAFERAGLVDSIGVDEGQRVNAGAVLARLDTDLLDAQRARQQADVDRLGADLELAELTAKRQKQLFEDGHVSEQRFDDARLRVSSLAAQKAAAEAALKSTLIDLEKSILRAPFDAVISARSVDTGSVINAGAPILTLLEVGTMRARIGLSSGAASAVEGGAPYRMHVAGVPVQADLVSVRPDMDPNTRTRDGLFDIAQTPGMAFGDITRLEVERTVKARGFWLPVTALREGRKGLWLIFTVPATEDQASNQAGEPRLSTEAVEVLYATEDEVYVRGPVASGTAVVARGLTKIVTGQRVDPIPASTDVAAVQE